MYLMDFMPLFGKTEFTSHVPNNLLFSNFNRV